MTGYLMVRCGKCGATNRVRSLDEPPKCVECTLEIHGDGEAMLIGVFQRIEKNYLAT